MDVVAQGIINAADLTGGAYYDVANLTAPADEGRAYSYLLVMRFSALDPAHVIRVRSRQGAVVQRDVFVDQYGNGQTNDEVQWADVLAYGEEAITISITDSAGVSAGVGGFWYLHRESVNSGGGGSGNVSIDHNGGAGVTVNGGASAPDVLAATDPLGNPIDDAEVVAFRKVDYLAGLRGRANVQGYTRTDSDGRWVDPIDVNPGTYVLEFRSEGRTTTAVEVVVPGAVP